MTEPIIFEYQGSRRQSFTPLPDEPIDLQQDALRQDQLLMPQVSELQAVRHYTRLSQLNYSIETNFYPLGSCTMKYNPKICNRLAMLQGFLARHPLAPEEQGQGFLQCLFELQQMLEQVTGMAEVSLTPMAGAQGELAGVAIIRAYHLRRGDTHRRQIIVPDAAHGTNPATATMCGCEVVELATRPDGDLDLDALRTVVGPKTAGIMLTNPSTLGVFERQIEAIAGTVHDAGGLLYYDGANLNAILGKILPADMGFDVMHLNLHKTFSTPHGGGGPGSGAVGASERLRPFLPVPVVERRDGVYVWATESDRPKTIGRLSTYMGNAGVLLRAYVYMQLLGKEGMPRVADFATLNANYLMTCLAEADFDLAFPQRRASHEFIISLKKVMRDTGVKAMDFAKALLDRGMHAPTTYFPLIVPECLLIEPTETESKQMLDTFVAALVELRELAYTDPEQLTMAPHSTPVRRLDDVRAAKQPDLTWKGIPNPTRK